MRKLKSLSAGARVAVCTFMTGFVVGTQRAMAQANDGGSMGNQILNDTQSALSSLVSSIIGVLQILLGIAALVSLFVVVYNIFKQERDAAQKAIWWVVGLAAGWAALTVVGRLIGG